MGSFSFGGGNVAGLVRLPLYAAGRLATAVIPRTSERWVFGSAAGIADGALALHDVAAARGERTVWLTAGPRDERDAAARGIRSLRRGSLRGFWATARARVVVVTHGFGDVNRYGVHGAFVVQLWHGIPLKRIGLDSPATTRVPIPGASRLVAALYRRAQHRIGLLPAASHVVRGRLESAFGLPDAAVPVVGEPRVDVLSRGTAENRRSAARAGVDQAAGPLRDERLVLYAPTWRDGAVDAAVPTDAEWRALIAVLEEQHAVLLVRSHPLGAGAYTPPPGTDRVRMMGADVVADVTPLLPAIDVLVTDYSSLAYDSALVPVPVVYLAPDLERYRVERGFYGRYDDVAGIDVARDWTAATEQLARVLGDDGEQARRLDRARKLDHAVHAFRDGRSAERVYDRIVGRGRRGRGTS